MVLFVCTGNTCRSPMAAALYKKMGNDASSAGISVYTSSPPSFNAVLAMDEKGIDIRGHVSRQISEKDLEMADKVYVMTGQHLRHLLNAYPLYSHKISTLSDTDISDPFGGNLEEYRECAKEIEKALLKL